MAALVRSLAADGLIERTVDPHDRRAMTIRLAEPAQAMLQTGFAELTDRIDSVIERLPERDRRVVADFLARVGDAGAEAAAAIAEQHAADAPVRRAG